MCTARKFAYRKCVTTEPSNITDVVFAVYVLYKHHVRDLYGYH